MYSADKNFKITVEAEDNTIIFRYEEPYQTLIECDPEYYYIPCQRNTGGLGLLDSLAAYLRWMW